MWLLVWASEKCEDGALKEEVIFLNLHILEEVLLVFVIIIIRPPCIKLTSKQNHTLDLEGSQVEEWEKVLGKQ